MSCSWMPSARQMVEVGIDPGVSPRILALVSAVSVREAKMEEIARAERNQ